MTTRPATPLVPIAPEGAAGPGGELRALEARVLARLGGRPGARPDEASLQRVAARVIALTDRASAEVVHVAGPIDVVPGDVSVGGRLRLAGASGVERRPGDLVYSGELVMTGKRSIALLRLPGEALVWIGPASAMLWWRDREAVHHHRARLMAGKIVCVSGPRTEASGTASRWTVFCPGGELETEGGAAQLAVRSLNATQVEVVSGTARITNPRGEVPAGRLERVIISALQVPARQPVTGHANVVGWIASQVGPSDLPAAARARLEELLRQGQPSSATESERAVDAEDRRRARRRRLLMIGGAVVLLSVAVASAWLAWMR